MQKCNSCKYWAGGAADKQAKCCFMPPEVIVIGIPVDEKGNKITSPLQQPAGMVPSPAMFWRLTASAEGCGQHAPKVSH